MTAKTLIFSNNSINKNTFHKRTQSIEVNKIDIKRIVVSDKDCYGKKSPFKYFIGDMSNVSFVPLCINLPQLSWYTKYFSNNNYSIN